MTTSALIQKVWNFCHTLRDDGVGYGAAKGGLQKVWGLLGKGWMK